MLDRILGFAIDRRWIVVVSTALVALFGVISFYRLPIDAVPDITNIQVQINTTAKALSTLEVEQRVTHPIEWALGGVPHVQRARSSSRYGLSQITVVFDDGTDVYRARQLVGERLILAREQLPPGIGDPQLGPIATGLGEIFQYELRAKPGAKKADGTPYQATDLRVLQDWLVRPSLRSTRGVTEVNSIGGFERLYQVSPDPAKLHAYHLSFGNLLDALAKNNANAGGGYIDDKDERYIVRATGLVRDEADIRSIVVGTENGVPVRIRDVAEVGLGKELRTGAATVDGEESIVGTTLMLAGGNSRVVARAVDARLKEINRTLPPEVEVRPLYDRTDLVDATLGTVKKSLLEGALLVIAVLLLMLGDFRAAIIAALAIPLSMLFAVSGMVQLGISGNLMSLGAIDFGLIVDGAVIVVENCVRCFGEERRKQGRPLRLAERLHIVRNASQEVSKATVVGVLIIGIVYLPILSLTGVEGKMFSPMAITVVLALTGAMILSITFVPAMVALLLRGDASEKENFLLRGLRGAYARTLDFALSQSALVVAGSIALLVGCGWLASRLGTEFSPRLSEGALVLTSTRIASTSLTTSVTMEKQIEKKLRGEFPDEIASIFALTGTADVATDPMGPNVSDAYILLTPREKWKKAKTQGELTAKIDEVVQTIPGQNYEFSQPIEMRFNDLVAGVRSDVAVKIFGEDLDVLKNQAARVEAIFQKTPGSADVKVEQVSGLPVLTIDVDRDAIARHGLNVSDVHAVVEAAIGGKTASTVFDGSRRFNLVLRLPDSARSDLEVLRNLPIHLPQAAGAGPKASFVPLGALAHISVEEGPAQVSHELGRRRIVVQSNVRGRDLGGFVSEVQHRVEREVQLPPGYSIQWGGQFENLMAARSRLAVVVPVALLLIFLLLMLSFGRAKNAALIFTGVPLALTGGIVALTLRGIPVSIAAAIGFIALSGVAVLNGLVIVTFVEKLRRNGASVDDAVRIGARERLRPVLMTALVAALGFVPMALATGIGSEVQRPLATVVIGGILSSTALTLLVLPVLYRLVHSDRGAVLPDEPE